MELFPFQNDDSGAMPELKSLETPIMENLGSLASEAEPGGFPWISHQQMAGMCI